MFAGRKHGGDCGCESAPVVVKHAPVHAAPASCGCEETCKKPRLCDRLKARHHKGNDCGCEGGYGATAGGCGCGGAYGSTYGGTYGGYGSGSYGTGVITSPSSAEPIQAQPKPSGGAPMPSKPTTPPATTPMTFNGVISNVTPVAAPASPF